MIIPLLLASAAVHTSACRAEALRLALDGKDGDFNGMSHSGVLVVLRNEGKGACSVPVMPRIMMLDGRGRQLPIARRVAPKTQPGPTPLTIRPGAVASTPLRWVSGPVFDHGRCYRPTRLAVALPPRRIATRITTTICGEAGKVAEFEQPPLGLLKQGT